MRWLDHRSDHVGKYPFMALWSDNEQPDDELYVLGRTSSGAAVPHLLRLWGHEESAPPRVVSETELPRRGFDDMWDAHIEGFEQVRCYVEQVCDQWQRDPDFYTKIADRARSLEATHRQPRDLADLYALEQGREGSTQTYQWVDPRLIVSTPPTPQWGEFGTRRPERVGQLIDAWMNPNDTDGQGIRSTLDDSAMVLYRIPGPDGPLYINDTDGTHRSHAARFVELPLVWAEVHQPSYTQEALERVHAIPGWEQAYSRAYRHTSENPRGTAPGWGSHTPAPDHIVNTRDTPGALQSEWPELGHPPTPHPFPEARRNWPR